MCTTLLQTILKSGPHLRLLKTRWNIAHGIAVISSWMLSFNIGKSWLDCCSKPNSSSIPKEKSPVVLDLFIPTAMTLHT